MKLKNVSRIDFSFDEKLTKENCNINKYTPDSVWEMRHKNPTPTDFGDPRFLGYCGSDYLNNMSKVLEIGCGCGRNAQFFIEKTPWIKYYGFDPNSVALKYFKRQNFPKDKYYISKNMDKEIMFQEYDMIFFIFVLQHIGFLKDESIFDSIRITKNLFDNLKIGGYWISYELKDCADNIWNSRVWFENSFDVERLDVKCFRGCILKGSELCEHDLFIARKIK